VRLRIPTGNRLTSLLLFVGLSASASPFFPLYFHYQGHYVDELGQDQYASIAIVRKARLSALVVTDLDGNEIPDGDLRNEVIAQRIEETKKLQNIAGDFAIETLQRDLAAAGLSKSVHIGPKAEADIRGVASGEQPFILVTALQNPYFPLQMFSLRDGTAALEARLGDKGWFEKVRPPDQFDHSPLVLDINPMTPMATNYWMTMLLTARPWAKGGLSEMKGYYRSPLARLPWGILARRLFIAIQLSRYGARPIPENLRKDGRCRALRQAFEEFTRKARGTWSDEDIYDLKMMLYDPYYQPSMMNTHFVLETIMPYRRGRHDRARVELFKRRTGFNIYLGEDEDPDIDGVRTAVLAAMREEYEFATATSADISSTVLRSLRLRVSEFPSLFSVGEAGCRGRVFSAGDWVRLNSGLYLPGSAMPNPTKGTVR
jgi:hypothetical protein